MWRRHKRAAWVPADGSWSSGGIFQWPGGSPLRSVGSKAQARFSTLQHRSQKETQITSSSEKPQGFCLPGRDDWRVREPLKGPAHKTEFVATYPGHWQKEGPVDQRSLRRVWSWWLWRVNWRNSYQDPYAESFCILQRQLFLGKTLFSKWHQSEGK